MIVLAAFLSLIFFFCCFLRVLSCLRLASKFSGYSTSSVSETGSSCFLASSASSSSPLSVTVICKVSSSSSLVSIFFMLETKSLDFLEELIKKRMYFYWKIVDLLTFWFLCLKVRIL